MTPLSYDPLAATMAWLGHVLGVIAEPASPLWWPTLLLAALATLAFAFGRHLPAAELRRLLLPAPPRLYLRRLANDGLFFLVNSALPFLAAPLLLLTSAAGASLGVALLTPLCGLPMAERTLSSPGAMLFAALLCFIATDFALYWTHRAFHTVPVLWRAHRLHHEPAVLTPLTAFRFWPHEQIVHITAGTFMNGLALGLVATLYGARVDPLTLLGVNAFTLIWNLAFSHLRHSHVPLPFPRWLSFVLVSPHMHQAHHSAAPRHHDKNFATVFALWDWLFGTLYLLAPQERFHFGLMTEAEDTPHPPPEGGTGRA